MKKLLLLPIFFSLVFFCSCAEIKFNNFYKACANNDIDTCKILLEKNPDIPMIIQNRDIILSWLEHNKPEFYPNDGTATQWVKNYNNSKSVARITTICNSIDVLSFLFENGKIDDFELNDALSLAVEYNQVNSAKILLQNNANPNFILNDTEYKKISLLNYAVKKNYIELAALLIEFEADVNAKTEFMEEKCGSAAYTYNKNETPLHSASARGQVELVKLLLQHGAEVDARDIDGETPLMWASDAGYTNTMAVLLQNGADINAKNNFGCTALIKLSMRPNYANKDNSWNKERIAQDARVVKFLIEHNVNKNIRYETFDNFTALEYAVKNKKNPIIEILLDLDDYEEWSPAKIEILGIDNVGKKICVRDSRVTMILGNDTIILSDEYNSTSATYNRFDSKLKMNLPEKLILLNQKCEETNRNAGYADFFGIIERTNSGRYATFRITNILER